MVTLSKPNKQADIAGSNPVLTAKNNKLCNLIYREN